MGKINYYLINFAIIMIIFFFIIITKDVWINMISFILKIISPIIISFVIAYTLDPVVKIINKKIKNNYISVIITLLLFLIIIFLICYYSVPLISKELTNLTDELIPFFDKLINKLDIENYKIIEQILLNNIIKISKILSNNTLLIITKSVSFIKDFILIIILSIYFLFSLDKIKLKTKEILEKKKKTYTLLKNINNSLNKYIKSIGLIIIIEIIEYTIIYFLIGHPNYILIGLLAGLTTVIPFFGSLFTNLIALITAISISNKLFILCSIIIIVLPLIDNYIIDPKIYNKTIKTDPIKTIIIVIISSSVFGVIGLITAIPIYIILKEIIEFYFL